MRLFSLALVMCLAACDSSGTDAPAKVSKGEFCDTVGQRVCARSVTCGLQKMDECFQGFKTSCCLGKHTCEETGFRSETEFHDWMAVCGPAIDTQACDQALVAIPTACLVGLN